MDTLPLLTDEAIDAPVAQYRGATVYGRTLVAHAERVAGALPSRACMINLAENRYHFLVGWCAACLRDQVTLLPSGQSAGTLAQLTREYPDHHVFDDEVAARLLADANVEAADTVPAHWQLPAERIVAITFTSGSTSVPQPHAKTWRSLFENSRLAVSELMGGAAGIVATVPAQHMYGLEASLIGALSAGSCLFDGKPFFPADVMDALMTAPAPRTLVTTPAHLKVLADANVRLPALHRIVSATAPLSRELAERAERLWKTTVVEIYGCTEAGVIAHRRTTLSEQWTTFGAGSVRVVHGIAQYNAPQLPDVVPLQDMLEATRPSQFILRGRSTDMIKVAGKRASLQDLTRQLLALPGVEDAVVFVPEADTRPAALVVAPGMSASEVQHQLHERIEAVFVPRPLLVVERLPRNAVGKLPHEALMQALARARLTVGESFVAPVRVAPDHPSLPGHFPGNPLVPGVVLLDEILAAIRMHRRLRLRSIPNVKFLNAVQPGNIVEVAVTFTSSQEGTRATFRGMGGQKIILEGSFDMSHEATA